MSEELKRLLLHQKVETTERIIDLSTDKGEARKLFDKVRVIDNALSKITSTPGPYAAHRRAIDAVVEYLQGMGSPQAAEQIVVAVVEGGFRGGDTTAESQIRKSIGYHIHVAPRGLERKLLREMNGLIGLYEWPDEMWPEGSKADTPKKEGGVTE